MITMPFISGNSQAVRLPKAFAFEPNVPVSITKQDDKLIIEPVKTLANAPALFAELGKAIEKDRQGGESKFMRDTLVENERSW